MHRPPNGVARVTTVTTPTQQLSREDLIWLRQWIGLQGAVDGRWVEWIDVLDDGPSVVLLDVGERRIQTSQYARPTQRGARTFTVPVWSELGDGVHPSLVALLPTDALQSWLHDRARRRASCAGGAACG